MAWMACAASLPMQNTSPIFYWSVLDRRRVTSAALSSLNSMPSQGSATASERPRRPSLGKDSRRRSTLLLQRVLYADSCFLP